MIMLDHYNMTSSNGMVLGTFGWSVGMWVTMTAAMMLPSVTPMVITFARVSSRAYPKSEDSTCIHMGFPYWISDSLDYIWPNCIWSLFDH
ncbi:DUF2182 domain-containing protein [Bacillus cereus]|uniref:copper chaperone n=1 Tax=Bacillus cereus TaxID=1396 RepID=UPI003BF72682